MLWAGPTSGTGPQMPPLLQGLLPTTQGAKPRCPSPKGGMPHRRPEGNWPIHRCPHLSRCSAKSSAYLQPPPHPMPNMATSPLSSISQKTPDWAIFHPVPWLALPLSPGLPCNPLKGLPAPLLQSILPRNLKCCPNKPSVHTAPVSASLSTKRLTYPCPTS